MIQNLVFWLNTNATPLGSVGMILLDYCLQAVFIRSACGTRKLVRHVLIPFTLGSFLVMLALGTLLFLSENRQLSDHIVLGLLAAHLLIIVRLFLQHRKEQQLRQDFLQYILPTIRRLSPLFADGKLMTLDSRSPKSEVRGPLSGAGR